MFDLDVIERLRPAADTVGDDGKAVENAAGGVPCGHDDGDADDLQDLQGVEGLALIHHPVGDARTVDDGEDGGEDKACLQDQAEGTAAGGKCWITKEVVGVEEHLVDLLLEEIGTNAGTEHLSGETVGLIEKAACIC